MAFVSIIIPCYNEQATIRLLLDSLYCQTYPRQSFEVIIADGLSRDRTRDEIAAFLTAYPDLALQLVDNPKRNIPSALNQGLKTARGEIIIRLDAHSIPQADYIARCVQDLEQGLGDTVGGVWDIRPGGKGWLARAIAVSAAHPLGVGDARYRTALDDGGHGQAVDTVPFGAFYHDLIKRIGPYDESLLTNEDYEFNTRVRQSGGKVWLDPAIRIVYFARSSLGALARQYWRYGYWKWRMLQRYPRTLRWRQALPPLFVISLIILAGLSIFVPLARITLLAEIGLYGMILLAAGIQAAIKHWDPGLLIGLPLSIITMHLCWGAGFLWSTLHLDTQS